jgi:DNA-binding transcriptional regulator YdaS (Cro superfamily)
MDKSETLALRRAVEQMGGQSALARVCGVKQGHVWHWLNKSLRVPAEHVLAVESATGGAVSRQELRPDIFGDAHTVPGPQADRAAAVAGQGAITTERLKADIADQIAALEAKQHRAVRETLLNQSGAADRLAKLDRAIAALRALTETGE